MVMQPSSALYHRMNTSCKAWLVAYLSRQIELLHGRALLSEAVGVPAGGAVLAPTSGKVRAELVLLATVWSAAKCILCLS